MNQSGVSFDFEDHLAFEFAKAFVHQEKRNEDRRYADRDEPFITDVAGRMER